VKNKECLFFRKKNREVITKNLCVLLEADICWFEGIFNTFHLDDETDDETLNIIRNCLKSMRDIITVLEKTCNT